MSLKSAALVFSATLLVVLLTGLSIGSTRQLMELAAWREHTRVVVAQVREVLALCADARIRPATREVELSTARIREAIGTLRRLTSDNPRQQRSIDHLARIAERDAASMESIRALLFDMEAEEGRLLVERERGVKALGIRTTRTLVGGGALSVAALLAVFVVLDREVRVRRHAERARDASEARLQAILDHSPAAIFVKDLAGRFVLVNRQFERGFGRSGTELLGRTAHDFFPPEMADAYEANDDRVLRSGTPLEFEETLPQDGGDRTYSSIKFPLRDLDGTIRALCAISTDITDRERL